MCNDSLKEHDIVVLHSIIQ